MTRLRAGAATDVGRVRSINQDCFLVEDGLWAVADGMGGHAAGDVAARVAVETLQAAYDLGRGDDALAAAIRQANQAVWDRSHADTSLRGMGTTLTAVASVDAGDGAHLVVANVGDSRAYLFESGELSQLTADHSLVEELVRAGELSPGEAADHPQRHIVTRALGIEPEIEVDTWIITPHAGDRFVVCSDGLSNEVDDNEMGEVLRQVADAQSAADRLVEMARAHGGTDNITVIVLDVTEDDAGPGRIPGRAEVAEQEPAETEAAEQEPAEAEAAEAEAAEAEVAQEEASADAVPVISTRPPPTDEAVAPALARASRATVSTYKRPRRFTLRVGLFVLALLVVVAGAAAAVVWYARASYYVGLQGAQLVIYKGRPGGVLWFHPTLVQRTDVTTAEVPRDSLSDLSHGMVESSRQAAVSYVQNLVNEYQAENPTPTTTTVPSAAPGSTTPTSASAKP